MSKVVPSNREIIEGKLLAALDDADKVACVFSSEDLDDLIDLMECGHLNTRTESLLRDLRKLREAAFGARE